MISNLFNLIIKGNKKMVVHKKGQVWIKAKTALMKTFEKETGKSAVFRDKITGQFEYWIWQKEKKLKSKPKSKAKPKEVRIPWLNDRVKRDILNAMKSGKELTFRTINNRTEHKDYNIRRALKELEADGKIFSSKKYKPDPSGRGLSREYKWVWRIMTSPIKKPKPKPKPDVERFWNRMPQPQKRRSMFLSDLEYDGAFMAINKKKQWIDIPNSLQKEIKKEKNARVLKEIYNLSKTEFDEIYEEDINFNQDEIENGDYVDFGAYGSLYVVYRRDERNFWVTNLEDKRYNDNAPGWIIRINQAERIIEKG